MASEAELGLDASNYYNIDDIASPAYASGASWATRFPLVDFPMELNRDRYGYSLLVNGAYTAGAYAGFEQYINDTTAPTISAGSITNITATGFDINITASESSTHYYVVVADGATVPSVAQIIAGQNASGVAAVDSGNDIGVSTIQTASGLTASTAYDIHVVAVDGAGNQSAINSEDATTTSSTSQVTLEEVGATSGTVGITQRASLGTLTPDQPVTGIAAGDLLVCMVSIRATGGTADISGWTQVGTHRMGTTSNGEFYIFAKIATGSESGAITVTFPNDFAVTKMARTFRFRNNNTASVAAAIESVATNQATSTTYSAANVTSTVNLALAVQFVAIADDNVTGSMTGKSGGDVGH
jgi:hypothetical protein